MGLECGKDLLTQRSSLGEQRRPQGGLAGALGQLGHQGQAGRTVVVVQHVGHTRQRGLGTIQCQRSLKRCRHMPLQPGLDDHSHGQRPCRASRLSGCHAGELGLRLVASHALMNRLAEDASGDALDATLCLIQAAWAAGQHAAGHPRYGLPECDPLEGWIVTA